MLDIYRHDEPHYPSSDDEPMGENDVICWLMTTSLDMLRRYFQTREDVYVSSNSFVYYVKGDPKQRVAPDLYVVKGVSSAKRLNYKVWEEGAVPQVVFEFTTESSRYKDLGTKKGLYEALGVREYYLFDPVHEYLVPPFRAFHLVDGVLHEREQRSSHFSEELGLTIKPVDQLLRFYPPDSVQPIPTSGELQERVEQVRAAAFDSATRAEQEAARAEREAARADELEKEIQRLKGEL